MTNLRARARELAQDARRTVPLLFTRGDMDRLDAAITDAIILGMVEALEAEPDDIEVDAANRLQWEDTYSYRNVFRAMAAARAREIKEGK